MSTTNILIGLAALCVVWYVVVSILICSALGKRGIKINYFLLRLMMPSYAGKYRKITREETGKTGPLFYHWIISINATLVCVILAILTR